MRRARGIYLEKQLEKVIDFLRSRGIHGHKNHARRTKDGTYVEGEPFDYEVFCNGKLHVWDAKECHGSRWNLTNAKPHQLKHLLDCRHHGAEAFFLVLFHPDTLVAFDAEVIRQKMAAGQKSVTPAEGRPWDWQTLHR
jgi:penicillin-binding protein-related factor A (putative recombinase)